jgi:hypothetical protein
MASAAYVLFRRAILERQQITCMYDGYLRELCPHVLGRTDGEEKVLAYQFAGGSRSGLPPQGEWRCLFLAQVRDTRMRAGRWHTGCRHRATQTCVALVDVDVNA